MTEISKALVTITNRQEIEKAKLIEQLKKTPIIQLACEKAGIGRATYYRWFHDDLEFASKARDAISHGNDLVNDMAETQLLTAIRERNLTAILFWLKSHHPAYRTRVEVEGTVNTIQELSPEQKELIKKALELTGINITSYAEPQPTQE